MIRLLSVLGMAASGGVLLVYESLTKADRLRADAAAKEAVQDLAHFAMGQISPNYSDRMHQIFRHHN